MILTEKYNKLGNAICPICGTAICLKNSCTSEYHKIYTDIQIKLNLKTMATKSKKFSLNGHDFLKGLIVSVITAVLSTVYSIVQTNGLENIDYKFILTTTVLSVLGYLTKNLTENSDGKILKK